MNSIFYVAIALFFGMATLGFWIGAREARKLRDPNNLRDDKQSNMEFFVVIFAFFFAIAMTVIGGSFVLCEYNPPDIEQQTITIEDKWCEKDGCYRFSDTDGYIYYIKKMKPGDEVFGYNQTFRGRYNNLIIGQRYVVDFYHIPSVMHIYMRDSVNEKKVEGEV